MKKIDFDKEIPYFTNEDFKWYIDDYFHNYIISQQAENLPYLENLECFIVINKYIQDYVLINNKQNILASFPYTIEGLGQMEARINIMKINKYYDDSEKVNV